MRSKIIAHNSLLATADMVFSLVASTVTVILVARVMGPEKLGYYAYVMWIVGVATIVGQFGVPSATRKYVIEFLGKGDVATARRVIESTFRLQLGTSLVLTATGIAIALVYLTPEHQGYTALALLSIVPNMLMAIPTSAQSAIENYADNVYPSIAAETTNLVGVSLVLWFGWGLMGLSAVLLIARSLDFCLRYFLYTRRYPTYLAARYGTVPPPAEAIPPELRQRMVRFCWHASGLLVLNMVVWNRSEIFFLKHFCDIREVAFYSMSFGIVRSIASLPHGFGRAAGVNLMVQQGVDPKRLPQLVATTLRFQALLYLPMALGMAALSSPLVKLLYGSQYEPAIPVLAMLACFSIPSALMLAVNQVLIASEDQPFLLKWGVVSAVLCLLLDWWLIPSGGAMGAALGNGIAQTVSAMGIWAFAVRRFAIPLPWRPLFKMTASAVAMAILVAAVTHFLAPAWGTAIGLIIGVSAFFLLLRWTRGLEPADQERLANFQQFLPGPLRNWYALGLQMVVTRT